jgi:hypothetical protein
LSPQCEGTSGCPAPCLIVMATKLVEQSPMAQIFQAVGQQISHNRYQQSFDLNLRVLHLTAPLPSA